MAEPASHSAALLLAGAALLVVWGFAGLALAMDAHWQQVFGSGPGGQQAPSTAMRRLLRALGSLLLLASLGLCLRVDHPSMAVLVWLMLLAGGALLLSMILAWRPRWLRLLWPVPNAPDSRPASPGPR